MDNTYSIIERTTFLALASSIVLPGGNCIGGLGIQIVLATQQERVHFLTSLLVDFCIMLSELKDFQLYGALLLYLLWEYRKQSLIF